MERTIGAFIFPDVWQAWSPADADRMLKALRDFGVNTIATESETYRDDLIDMAHRLNMRFMGGIACFSDHAHNHQLLHERPELWPVLETGERRPQMEWYIGVTPTFEDYNQARLDLVERLIRQHELDAMCLDFIRWPLHWELELRPGAPPPLQSSFDPHTVNLFLKYANLDLPAACDTISRQAAWILSEHRAIWTDFKCSVITDFVRQARERIRSYHSGAASLGTYLVPAPDVQRAALVGQRIRDLTPHVDFLAPMVYHAILHQTAAWVLNTVDEIANAAPGKAIPVLQVDSAEGAEMGADWGPPVPVEEWQTILAQVAGRRDTAGITAFTGTSLLRDERGSLLRSRVSGLS